MFYWRHQVEPASSGELGIDWGFTSATGPRQEADALDYGAFNLGGHVGDDPGLVEANRGELAAAVAVPREHLIFMAQTHGTTVVQVDGPWQGDPPQADAIVSTSPDLALAVLVADCVPLLLADVGAGVVAAVHAGRPGMIAGIVPRTLDVMADAGREPHHRGRGTVGLRPVLRGAVRHARRSRPHERRERHRLVERHARDRCRRRGRRPAARGRRRRHVDSRLHPGVRPAVLVSEARHHGALRRRHPAMGPVSTGRGDRRPALAAGARACWGTEPRGVA